MRPSGPTRAALVALLAAVVAGVTPGAEAQTSREKVLTLTFDVKAVSLDPATSAERTTTVLAAQFYDALVARDDKGEFVPWLAQSWSRPAPTEWVFRLRRDVRLHDGRPFTAADVKFTLDRYMDPVNTSPMGSFYTFLEAVEVKDDRTVVFRTKEVTGSLLSSLAITPILGEKPGVDWANQVYGTGPFTLAEFRRGEQVVMVRNPDYWAGPPRLTKVIWKEVPEQVTRLAALERGDVDLVVGLNAEDLPRLAAHKNVKVVQAPTYRIRWLWLHAGKKPFNDVRVRQAVRHAVDTGSLVKHLMGEMATPALGTVAPTVFGYTPQSPYRYDPARARALLREAGHPDGVEVSLDFPLAETKQKELAETIAAQLEEVGIRITLRQKDRAVWLKDLTSLNWDMNLFAHSTLGGDADYTLRRVFISSANRTGYANPELDRWLVEAARHPEPAKRLEAYRRANKVLWNDGPVVYLFVHTQGYAHGPRVTRFKPPADDIIKLVDLDVRP
jgi:peptide/nickel transport system substrate-binding protein